MVFFDRFSSNPTWKQKSYDISDASWCWFIVLLCNDWDFLLPGQIAQGWLIRLTYPCSTYLQPKIMAQVFSSPLCYRWLQLLTWCVSKPAASCSHFWGGTTQPNTCNDCADMAPQMSKTAAAAAAVAGTAFVALPSQGVDVLPVGSHAMPYHYLPSYALQYSYKNGEFLNCQRCSWGCNSTFRRCSHLNPSYTGAKGCISDAYRIRWKTPMDRIDRMLKHAKTSDAPRGMSWNPAHLGPRLEKLHVAKRSSLTDSTTQRLTDYQTQELLPSDSRWESLGNSIVYRKSSLSQILFLQMARHQMPQIATGPRTSAPSSASLRGARGSSSAMGSAPTIAVLGATAVAAAALRKKDSQAVKATALQAFENELGVAAA